MKHRIITLILLMAFMAGTALAQGEPGAGINKKAEASHDTLVLLYGAQRMGRRQDAAMQHWRDNRLGLFLHWGLYAIPGGEWGGKVYPGAAEWLKEWAKVPNKDWLGLMKQWNPTQFDADAWARMAKAMGVGYVRITTKHHEGFCLWPSRYSRYTVAHTPYRKDLLRQLVDALDREGIDVSFYFSIMDWSHPDWRYDIKTREDSVAFERFKRFTENQLRELATEYPSVKDFWFDGTWDASIKKNGCWTLELEQMLKRLRPGVVVNSRLRADDYGHRHFDSNGHLMGDYESGYERKLPDPTSDTIVTTRDWEACMTLPENQWGYHKDWSLSYVKKPVEVLDWIIHAVSMGGNMVVNFGPKADGTFREEELVTAQWIGRWMQRYGSAVYGCGYAGWKKEDWGYYTRRGDTVNMIVFALPYSHLLPFTPRNGEHVAEATDIEGQRLRIEKTYGKEWHVVLPQQLPNEPFIVRLKINSEK